jgi:Amt family ammonium transporter
MIAGMSATLSGVLYMWIFVGKPDPSMMCNSMLAGLVAITAPCAFVSPVGAFAIGAIAGVLVILSVFFFDRIGIDDPVGASSVHGVCGAFGVLAVGLFADGTYGAGWNNVGFHDFQGVPGRGVIGLLYGGGASQLLAQCIEVGACVGWNAVVGGLAFWLVGKLVGNRVPPEVELAGLDIPEMGAPGYPEFITSVGPEEIPASDVAAAKASLGGRLATV